MILRLKVTSFMEDKTGTDAPLYLPKSVLQIGTERLPRSLSRELSEPKVTIRQKLPGTTFRFVSQRVVAISSRFARRRRSSWRGFLSFCRRIQFSLFWKFPEFFRFCRKFNFPAFSRILVFLRQRGFISPSRFWQFLRWLGYPTRYLVLKHSRTRINTTFLAWQKWGPNPV